MFRNLFRVATQPKLTRSIVDCTGLKIEEVFAELYNNAKPLGLGVCQYVPDVMSPTGAKQRLLWGHSWSYVNGRYMKVYPAQYPKLDERRYDSENGAGMMQKCVDNVRNRTFTTKPPIDHPISDEDKQRALQWAEEVWRLHPPIKIYPK